MKFFQILWFLSSKPKFSKKSPIYSSSTITDKSSGPSRVELHTRLGHRFVHGSGHGVRRTLYSRNELTSFLKLTFKIQILQSDKKLVKKHSILHKTEFLMNFQIFDEL